MSAKVPRRRLELMLTYATGRGMTEKAGNAPNHWPLLDFLRATAALLVLFAHTRGAYLHYTDVLAQPGLFLKLFYSITALGGQAVVIFFVLSGFLIGGSLADSMQRGSFDLVRYLVARFVRIYIVYLPALVITEAVFLFGSLLLSDPGAGHFRPLFSLQQMDFGGVSQAICHIAGLQGFSCRPWNQNPPLWSLGYEWALYLFAPAIIGLMVWRASPGLRLIGCVLVCAIVATVCPHPKEGVFWFIVWFLGAGSYRVLRAGLVPLPAGLLGAGLIIAGMAMALLKAASDLETGTIIAAGTAIAIACRPMVAFPLAPRLFSWAAGFSYTLYAIHLPLVSLIVALFQNVGFPPDAGPPSPLAFMEFGVTIAMCLLTAFLVSLITERKTEQIRAAMLRMCPRRMDREASDRR
jgi:peptidoglycan/LPS O-acetylase OafA/YrhL